MGLGFSPCGPSGSSFPILAAQKWQGVWVWPGVRKKKLSSTNSKTKVWAGEKVRGGAINKKEIEVQVKGTSKIQNGLPSSSTELRHHPLCPVHSVWARAMCSFSVASMCTSPPTKFGSTDPIQEPLPAPPSIHSGPPCLSTQTSTPTFHGWCVWRFASPGRPAFRSLRPRVPGREAGREGAGEKRQGRGGGKGGRNGSPERKRKVREASQPASLIGLDTVRTARDSGLKSASSTHSLLSFLSGHRPPPP